MSARVWLAAAGLLAAMPTWLGALETDVEPPEAQALAERLVAAGGGKTASVKPSSTRLKMRIVRIVDRRTGLKGVARAVEGEERSLDDRLRDLNAEVTDTEVIVRLPGSILFDFDSTAIRPDAARTLENLAGLLQAFVGRPVRIEGHTDSIASEDYNQRLSEQRAASVRDWLVGHGVEGGRLRVLGHGEGRPVADNSTAAGRQLNRRVEVVIEKRT